MCSVDLTHWYIVGGAVQLFVKITGISRKKLLYITSSDSVYNFWCRPTNLNSAPIENVELAFSLILKFVHRWYLPSQPPIWNYNKVSFVSHLLRTDKSTYKWIFCIQKIHFAKFSKRIYKLYLLVNPRITFCHQPLEQIKPMIPPINQWCPRPQEIRSLGLPARSSRPIKIGQHPHDNWIT